MNQELIDKEKQEARRGWIKLAIIIIFFTTAIFIREHVMNFSFVVGTSMEDTLRDGDILLVDVGVEKIERYDIITMRVGEARIIKRVIGLPGETIQIIDGKTYINGAEIEDQYAAITANGGVSEEIYFINEGEYFVLGDNRSASADSREFGSVSEEDVIGKVVFSIYPFNRKFH